MLSAVEGLKLVAPQLREGGHSGCDRHLAFLFWMQARGTDRVAKFFGPITVVWFLVLALGGLMHIVDDARVLHGPQSPLWHQLRGAPRRDRAHHHGARVSGRDRRRGALYADLGHFGRKPIQVAWLSLVLPALLLNYFGQGRSC